MNRIRIAWLGACLLAVSGQAATNYPAWWLSRGVVDTNAAATNDYAAVTAGQVKWLATNAYDELKATLPGGAGTTLTAMVRGFTPTNNYLGVNAGQVKHLAAAFYDRLIAAGYTNAYPWTAATTDDADWAVANIGQVKNMLAFDVSSDRDEDSLPDWWENRYFGATNAQTATGDYDVDMLTNSNEYWRGTSPTNADSDGDGSLDGAEVAVGTDPLSASSYPASIAGTTVYTGIQTGLIWVVAATSAASWTATCSTSTLSPSAYVVSNIPNLASYWVRAWRDVNGNRLADTNTEAWGEYSGNAIYITTNVAGINITLDRGDSDGDGLADWVETGSGVFLGAANTGSNPDSADTDGDGINDGVEVAGRTDPNNNDTGKAVIVIISPANGTAWRKAP